MPFTLSHPAAVVPLRRPLGRYAVLSALVVGSLTPDFPYFLGIGIRASTHTLASVVWFSVPAGWLAYLAFQLVLRRASVLLLPGPLRARLDPRPCIAAAGPVTVSLAVGALTHVVWDSFTHGSGFVVREIPVLRELLGRLWGYPIWSYRVLQHASTLLGAGVLGVATVRWARRAPVRELEPETPRVRRLRTGGRVAALLLPPALGLVVAFQMAPPVRDGRTLAWFVAYVVVAGLTTLVAVLGLLGLVLRERAPAWKAAWR